jgi:PilZ domain
MLAPTEKTDRRSADRFPLDREVRYKILSKKGLTEASLGRTINMSSTGIMFLADETLPPGRRLELAISWPAQLNNTTPLNLIARGRVIRCEDGRTAIEIQQYEFKTTGKTN